MDNPNLTGGAPGRRRAFRRLLFAGLISAVLLTALYSGVQYFGATHSAVAGVCGALSIERRGLPCDVPLPSGARLDSTHVVAGSASGDESDWTFTVPQGVENVLGYYHKAFATHGWPCLVETHVKGLYLTASGKSDRPGGATVVSFLKGNASVTQFEIGVLPHADLPSFLTCARAASAAPLQSSVWLIE